MMYLLYFAVLPFVCLPVMIQFSKKFGTGTIFMDPREIKSFPIEDKFEFSKWYYSLIAFYGSIVIFVLLSLAKLIEETSPKLVELQLLPGG